MECRNGLRGFFVDSFTLLPQEKEDEGDAPSAAERVAVWVANNRDEDGLSGHLRG